MHRSMWIRTLSALLVAGALGHAPLANAAGFPRQSVEQQMDEATAAFQSGGAEAAERQWRAIWTDAVTRDGPGADDTVEAAIGLSQALDALERHEEASEVRRRALIARRSHSGLRDEKRARLLALDGVEAIRVGDLARAAEVWDDAWRIFDQLDMDDEAGLTAYGLAGLYYQLNRPALGLYMADQAMALGVEPDTTQHMRALFRQQTGDVLGAVADFEDLLSRNPERSQDIELEYANALAQAGETDAAARHIDAALAATDGSADPAILWRRAVALDVMGYIRTSRRRYAEGEALHRLALSTADEAGDAAAPAGLDIRASLIGNLGRNLMLQGRYAEAEPLLRDVSARLLARDGEGALSAAYARMILAEALQGQAKHDEALALLEPMLDDQYTRLGHDNPMLAEIHTRIGRSQMAVGRLDEAGYSVQQAAQLTWNALPEGHPTAIERTLDYAVVMRRLGDPELSMWALRLAGDAVRGRVAARTFERQGRADLDQSRSVFRMLVDAAFEKASASPT